MIHFFRNTWLATISDCGHGPRFKATNWVFLILFLSSIVAMICFEVGGGTPPTYYRTYRGWFLVLPGTLLLLAFVGPIVRLASEEKERAVQAVLFWGLVGLLTFVITFIAAYSEFSPPPGTNLGGGGNPYDRLLNIVPAVIAIWGAGLGWYTQHQIAMKTQRTSHAFNLIMQTRTNSVYAENQAKFQAVYPVGHSMDAKDAALFKHEVAMELPDIDELIESGNLKPEDRTCALQKKRKIEAILAAKYLLNYYEFMARAIESGDLDEQVLYDTVGTTVIGLFNRTKVFREGFADSQPLAMQALNPIVRRWEKRKHVDGARVRSQA